ncbi:MAG: XdhC family protein [Anaeromyxobacteraceae bacterium]
MIHWQETASIVERLAATPGAGAALATVVRIEGSAYRRPGAKLLVEEGGATSGCVSGGCLEADVRETALAVLRSGSPRLRHYDTGADGAAPWGLGLGCEGAVDVFVQPVADPFATPALRRAAELVAARAAFALCTVVEGPRAGRALAWVPPPGAGAGGTGDAALDAAIGEAAAGLLSRGETALLSIDGRAVFVDALTPPPHLVVFGAGDDARPLARVAAGVGFDVTVVDHRPAYLAPERFPPGVRLVERRAADGVAGLGLGGRAFAVVQTHALEHDRAWTRALLAEPLAYLGVLGPRARTADLLRELGAGAPAHLFAPVGLDVGAEGAEQIAVSIVAEALAVRAGRPAGHLRARGGSIHAG